METDFSSVDQESPKQEGTAGKHERDRDFQVWKAVRERSIADLMAVNKTPEDVHNFTTSCAERFPLLHLILQSVVLCPTENETETETGPDKQVSVTPSGDSSHSSPKDNDPNYLNTESVQEVIQFLQQVPELHKLSDRESADGRKAGQYFAEQAQAVLLEAAESDHHLPIVAALLRADTKIDEVDGDTSPLMCASKHGSTEVLKVLIEHNVAVDWCNASRETSFIVACKHRQWQAARLLFDAGADVFHCDDDWKSGYNIAIDNHAVDLLQHIAMKNKSVLDKLRADISLSDACQYGYDKVVEKYDLTQASAAEINDAVKQACLSKNTTILKRVSPFLLDKLADVDYYDVHDSEHLTLLMAATLCSEVPLVKLLLEKGANPNCLDKTHRTALYIACDLGHHEIASLLLCNSKEGGPANPNLQHMPAEKTPLWAASMGGHLDLVSLLVDHKADPNVTDAHGCHLLLKAHEAEQHEVVRLLLKSGANPDGLADLSFNDACRFGYTERATAYIKSCVKIACENGFPETAINVINASTEQPIQKDC